jgi:hypothetical protein
VGVQMTECQPSTTLLQSPTGSAEAAAGAACHVTLGAAVSMVMMLDQAHDDSALHS